MSEVWDRVFQSDNTFFREEPSQFAILCFNHTNSNNVKRVLEMGLDTVETQCFLHQMTLRQKPWTILAEVSK